MSAESAKKHSAAAIAWTVISCLWLSGVLWFAYRQPVCPDIDQQHYSLSDWLSYPLELNPAARLTDAHGPWTDIAASPNGKTLCIVGARGFIATSNDGGMSWRQRECKTEILVDGKLRRPHLHAVAFNDDLHGWVVGERGFILATNDGGTTWTVDRELGSDSTDLTCVAFQDASRGYAGGMYATTLAYDGKTWTELSRVSPAEPAEKSMPSPPADEPPPEKPPAGARKSPRLKERFTSFLEDAPTDDPKDQKSKLEELRRGPAAQAPVQPPNTSGQMNTPSEPEPTNPVVDHIAINDNGDVVYILGAEQLKFDSQGKFLDSMEVFKQEKDVSQQEFVTPDVKLNFALLSGEAALRLQMYFASEFVRLPVNGLDRFEVLDVVRSGPQRFVVASEPETKSSPKESETKGRLTVLTVKETNKRPSEIVPLPKQDLPFRPFRIAQADQNHLWVIGTNGELIGTRDGGNHWYPLTRETRRLMSKPAEELPTIYLKLPAVWTVIPALAPLLLLVATRSLRQPKREVLPGVSDQMASDKPLTTGERDLLEFGPMAQGISRFLRNENTAAPLTLSVEGEWGSGKSSLMNLIRGDLERYGFRTVWFNAWHHQREENLLSALLEALKRHAAPSLFDFQSRSLKYCAKLWLRKIREPAFSVRIVWMCALLFFALLSHMQFEAILGAFLGGDSFGDGGKTIKALTTSAFGVGGAAKLYAALRCLRSFTINPAELLASKSASAKLTDLDRQTSLRYRFASEFHDFCEAFKPRNVVVFIDDLDRCDPETVAMTLECVNYLTSSGDCYIVLGIDYDRVRSCVAQKYANEAATMLQLAGGRNSAFALRQFADRYLEKLINLRIPLPTASSEQRQSLLLGERPAAAVEPPARFANLPRQLANFAPPHTVFAVAAVLFLVAYYLSLPSSPAGSAIPGAATSLSQTASSQPQTIPPPSKKRNQKFRFLATESAEINRNSAEQNLSALLWFVAGGLVVLLLGLLVVEVLTPDAGVLRDSDPFRNSLRRWSYVLERTIHTPRAVKRFINEVRYRAMLLQSPPRNSRRGSSC